MNHHIGIKKVIITGASGGPGQALVRLLLQNNIHVVVLARELSGRIKYLPNDPLIKIISCDLKDMENLYLKNNDYDVFFHFGWDFTNRIGRDDPYLQQINVKYTLDAIQLAKRSGCKAFVGCGSQAEYGDTMEKLSPTTECHPKLAYGMAKLCAGQLAKKACEKEGIKFNWIRVLSAYGPFDNPYNIINTVIINTFMGKETKLTRCEQIWDLLYNEDLAEAFLKVALYGTNGKVYTVGSGLEQTLRKQLEELAMILGEKCVLDFGALSYPSWQVMYMSADNTDIHRDTGWSPSTLFRDGVEKTIDNMRMFFSLYGDLIYEKYFMPEEKVTIYSGEDK